MIALILLGLVSAAYGQDCSQVNCAKYTGYNIDRNKHECRFKIIDGPTEDRRGLEIYTYANKWDPTNYPAFKTRECTQSKVLMTRTPLVEEQDVFKGRSGGSWAAFTKCCAPIVLDFCRHHVTLVQDCRGDGRSDDRIRRTEAVYKNVRLRKVIECEFHYFYNYLKCSFYHNCKDNCKETGGTLVDERQFYLKSAVGYVAGIDNIFYLIGDNDLKVSMRRELNGAGQVQLKASREQCSSQYVAMFDDEKGRRKTTMRTALEKNKDPNAPRYIEGVSIQGILGFTHTGACGPVAKGVWLVGN